ncbi:hypothetical protein P9196_05975 [Xylella fastidiosa subsp. multiplex]|nr:hypothetical protein [Xylella fastidiosa subsp. multiplex]
MPQPGLPPDIGRVKPLPADEAYEADRKNYLRQISATLAAATPS